MAIRHPKKTKNPPILSHEFIIQNHADIVSCIAMIFVIGLMFQATSPISSLFVAMQYNMTVNETEPDESGNYEEIVVYTYGIKDLFTAFFYFLICIVVHAVVQEYILDKMNRKMHLSKVKHSKFNESGQLIAFYLVSVVWGTSIIVKEEYMPNIDYLWEGYPHTVLSFMIKFFFLIQIAYWAHHFPELYFQKVKRDEISNRIKYSALYFVFITAAYLLNLTRLALCLLVIHYAVEIMFHLSRVAYFYEKTQLADTGFMVWNVSFVMVRLTSIILTVLTFWYGLPQSGTDEIDFKEGNFNQKHVRFNCLLAVCLLQFWMMWRFITFHQKRLKERKEAATAQRRLVMQTGPKNKSGKNVTNSASENGSLRRKSPKKKKVPTATLR